ncbi:DUF4129 domain-containing protein [Propionicicella superfundia]|uniref:DUF4129 domain-containing protein n=1 Tax=Propionicicella superfundia TaxID=348582 RepID=UPI000413A5A1|nr:DUF4129 domain-containing protein [Propionicicella superfundia]
MPLAPGAVLRVLQVLPLSPPIQIDRGEAQRRADEELSKAKYSHMPEWLTQIIEWAQRTLENIVRTVVGGPGSGGGVSWGLVALVLVLLGVVALVVWRVGLPRWRQVARPDAEVDVDQSVMPVTYRDRAEAAAARGDYRTAIRERFRAIVRELEFRTIIAPRPSRTAFEAAAAAARELPHATDPLYTAAELFSAVMYGDRAGTPAGWQQILDAERAVHAAADEPAGVAS